VTNVEQKKKKKIKKLKQKKKKNIQIKIDSTCRKSQTRRISRWRIHLKGATKDCVID